MTLDEQATSATVRRHDLDALRAIAMLLGILLHAALSFIPGAWMVQDSDPSGVLNVLVSAIHGFRMSLFFVVSGFFTMMLLRKRGMMGLIRQRAIRIGLPLLLGVATLAPAVTYAANWASRLPRTPMTPAGFAIPLPDRGIVQAYYRMLFSHTNVISIFSWRIQVFQTPIFHHLWFLWFLCWLIPGFCVAVWFARLCHLPRPPRWLVLSPLNLLWLIPLTLIPEWFMGYPYRPFGPDTCVGLLPMPHILIYYAVFFGFGAIYHDSMDRTGALGRWWWMWAALALGIILPFGLNATQGRLLSSLLQVAYAWMMIFAFTGFFASWLQQPRGAIRYMSDASYWLYLTHLPLLIVAQAWVRNWPLPGLLKCALLCAGVTGVLLAIYQLAVRYTWVGAMLNGRKYRHAPPDAVGVCETAPDATVQSGN